jgi:hypothetical protein
MGFCGKRLHDRSKKIAAPNVFFPACSVRIEARAGSPWFFLRGRGCGKALNYKGICYTESKLVGFGQEVVRGDSRTAAYDLPRSPPNGIGDSNARAKKNPN